MYQAVVLLQLHDMCVKHYHIACEMFPIVVCLKIWFKVDTTAWKLKKKKPFQADEG